MKIAVLMSSYNGEKYIREQIDSILNQVGDFQIELFVRDDGSKDSTQEILDEYKNLGKLKWYTGDNLGPAYSFYDLLVRCGEADFYAFSDQDDYWMPDKIRSGIEKLQGCFGPMIYFANAELVDAGLNSLGRNVYRKMPEVNLYTVMCAANILGCSMIFNHEMVVAIRRKPTPGRMSMHDSYLARVCVAIGGGILADDKSHMKYRQHGNNVLGISLNAKKVIKSRIHDIFTKAGTSIAEQAEVILDLYEDEMPKENIKAFRRIAGYRKNILRRISLACSLKTRYASKNTALKYRLSILFGNR